MERRKPPQLLYLKPLNTSISQLGKIQAESSAKCREPVSILTKNLTLLVRKLVLDWYHIRVATVLFHVSGSILSLSNELIAEIQLYKRLHTSSTRWRLRGNYTQCEGHIQHNQQPHSDMYLRQVANYPRTDPTGGRWMSRSRVEPQWKCITQRKWLRKEEASSGRHCVDTDRCAQGSR